MTYRNMMILLIAFSLFFVGLQLPASAQTVSSSTGSVTFNANNSENDDADKFLIGAAITVVAILLWVGWKADRNRLRMGQQLQESIDQSVVSTYDASNRLMVEDLRL